MKPALEVVPSMSGGRSLHAYLRSECRFDWNWHYHPEIELTLITRGFGTRLVGDRSAAYRPGEIVLLGPNLPHTWFSEKTGRSRTSNEAVVVQFLPSAFPVHLLDLPEFTQVRRLLAAAARGLRFPPSAAKSVAVRLRNFPKLEGLEAWLELTIILGLLTVSAGEPLAGASYRHRRSHRMGSRLGRITAHIEEKCAYSLTQSDAARFAGLTPTSFARFFRQMTGRTFVQFRNACRIRRAAQMLVETDRSILDISLASGFANLSNFNRRFRESFSLSPRDYRKLRDPQPAQRP